MKYTKYHGLGNDYLVIRPDEFGGDLEPKQVQLICNCNYGVGSDENGRILLQFHVHKDCY